jgi:CubicO group peptidase (beta-lactamase class C family)
MSLAFRRTVDRPLTRRSVTVGLGAVGAALAAGWSPGAAAEPSGCGSPIDIGDGWKTAAPATVGLDGARLCAMIGWLNGFPAANVHSILVVRHGTLVFEHYRRGNDEIWDRQVANAEHGPTSKHDIRSITKSITSMLVGIALDRKMIPGIDAAMFDYFPEYADLRTPEKARITLRHLLIMASGLEWDENIPYTDPKNSQVAMFDDDADHLRVALSPPAVAAAGSEWNYSAGCTELLAVVVRKASGMPIEAFAKEALFSPLGISDVGWERYPDKIASAASGLQLRPRDLARIGQLVLDRGLWNGQRIISEQWIDDATSPQIGPADRIYFYGYQWWLGRSLINRRELNWIAGLGLGGQRLFVVPALDLICVMTAGHYTDAIQNWLPLLLFNRDVLQAIA